jgi:hypothetical protein
MTFRQILGTFQIFTFSPLTPPTQNILFNAPKIN